MVLGQASFLIHISQQFLPILEGISVEKSKDEAGFISHLKIDMIHATSLGKIEIVVV